jgi:hypothetical protein
MKKDHVPRATVVLNFTRVDTCLLFVHPCIDSTSTRERVAALLDRAHHDDVTVRT